MGYVPFLRFNSVQYGTQVVLSVSAVLFLAGLVALLYGWKLYRFVVVLSTALAGAYLGWYLTYKYNWCPEKARFLGPVVLGLVGGAVAIPLQKAAVFLVGASAGFVSVGPIAADLIWSNPPGPTANQCLAVSGAAFLVMGFLSLLIFKGMVMVATSLFGATLALSGGVHIVQTLWFPQKDLYALHQPELAAAFAAVAVSGVVFQAVTHGKKKQAK